METFNDTHEIGPQAAFEKYKDAYDYLTEARKVQEAVETYGSLQESLIPEDEIDSIDWVAVEEQPEDIDRALFGADICTPLSGGGGYGGARGYHISMVALDKESGGGYEDFAIAPLEAYAKLNHTPDHFSAVHLVYVPDPQIHGKDARPFLLNKDIWQQQFFAYKHLAHTMPEIEAIIIRMSEADGLSSHIEWDDVSKLADLCEAYAHIKLKTALPDIDL